MLDWLLAIFIIISVLFMLVAIEKFREKQFFWAWVFTLLSCVTWYFLAAAILEAETPYQFFNTTSGNVETGVHTYSSKVGPEILQYFMLMGHVMFLFSIVQVFVAVLSWNKKRKNMID